MSEWKYTIDIYDEWQASKRGELSLHDLSKVILGHLRRIEEIIGPLSDPYFKALLDNFEMFAEDGEGSVDRDEFDSVMDELYDWGDQPVRSGQFRTTRMCWINTLFAKGKE